MDSPIVVSAYYIQNMIQLAGPNQTAKILEKLKEEKLFAEVEDNLEKLALKVAKDGKKVPISMDVVKKKFGSMMAKTDSKKLTKMAFSKTKSMAKKVKPKAVGKMVGIVGKKVPFVSVGVGAGMALWRILENPKSEEAWIKAGAELASGTAGCFPGIGTAVSLTIDGILVAADTSSSKKRKKEIADKESKDPTDKEESKSEKEDTKEEKKKEKVLISAVYTFSYQGTDVCQVSKLAQRFRVPQNFEIWFFCSDETDLPDHNYVDLLFYTMLSREAALQKINYADCVTPSNCCEKLLSGEMCNDYKVVLSGDKSGIKLDEFYFGLNKWTPKFESQPKFIDAIKEDDDSFEYFTLSQLVCDLGRKENFGQKCFLLFFCDRTDVSDEQVFEEKVLVWRDRVKQLVPETPSKDVKETPSKNVKDTPSKDAKENSSKDVKETPSKDMKVTLSKDVKNSIERC